MENKIIVLEDKTLAIETLKECPRCHEMRYEYIFERDRWLCRACGYYY